MLLFISSGAIFITGAIGFETLSGIQEKMNSENIVYGILYTFEELFEMLGIVLFIYALLCYIVEHFKPFSISVNKK